MNKTLIELLKEQTDYYLEVYNHIQDKHPQLNYGTRISVVPKGTREWNVAYTPESHYLMMEYSTQWARVPGKKAALQRWLGKQLHKPALYKKGMKKETLPPVVLPPREDTIKFNVQGMAWSFGVNDLHWGTAYHAHTDTLYIWTAK